MTRRAVERALIVGWGLITACASGGEEPAGASGATSGGGGGVTTGAGGSGPASTSGAGGGAGGGAAGAGGGGGTLACSREKCGTAADENCDGENCSGAHVWSRRYGPASGQQHSRGFGVDDQGRSTILGTFTESAEFGGAPLVSDGTIDIFVAKVDAAGDPLWSKSFATDANQVPVGATSGRAGTTLIYGGFSGSLDFGSGPIMGAQSLFVTKLDLAGDGLWARSFGTGINAFSLTALHDKDGDVIVGAGYFGPIDFGGGPITGDAQSFTVAKLDKTGAHVWSKQYPTVMATRVAVDGLGGILLAGEGAQADVGCGAPVGTQRYLAKLDALGACLWRKDVQGAAVDFIAAEGPAVIAAGRFNGTATIGGTVVSSPTATRFLVRLDAAGDVLWSFVFGDNTVFTDAIAVDIDGGVVAMGQLTSGSADFDGNAISGDMFLVRIDEAGGWVWGHGFPGLVGFPAAVAFDPENHVLLYGYATAPVDLGGGSLVGGGEPYGDVVLAKMKP